MSKLRCFSAGLCLQQECLFLPFLPQISWTEHTGAGCPVLPCSRPAIRFRNGAIVDAGLQTAGFWGERWTWMRPPSGFDIVAYSRGDCEDRG